MSWGGKGCRTEIRTGPSGSWKFWPTPFMIGPVANVFVVAGFLSDVPSGRLRGRIWSMGGRRRNPEERWSLYEKGASVRSASFRARSSTRRWVYRWSIWRVLWPVMAATWEWSVLFRKDGWSPHGGGRGNAGHICPTSGRIRENDGTRRPVTGERFCRRLKRLIFVLSGRQEPGGTRGLFALNRILCLQAVRLFSRDRHGPMSVRGFGFFSWRFRWQGAGLRVKSPG